MNVYFILKNNEIKIGHSKNVYARLKTLQTGSVDKLILIGTIFNCTKTMEKGFHLHFKAQHLKLEWFKNEGKLNTFINVMFKKRDVFDCDKENLVNYLADNNFSF